MDTQRMKYDLVHAKQLIPLDSYKIDLGRYMDSIIKCPYMQPHTFIFWYYLILSFSQ